MNQLQSWILSLDPKEYSIRSEGENKIIAETDYAQAEINFHEMDVVEFIIINKCSEENVFYLHFQLNDEERSHELYEEMITALLRQKGNDKTKVLLSCTSGLTTSFFAQKLNEAAELLSANLTFNAVSFNHIYESAMDYDMILLAPQVAFQLNNVKEVLTDKPVFALPATIFGSYDVGECMKFIQENFSSYKKEKTECECYTCCSTETKKNILIIGTLYEHESINILFKVYKNGEPVYENQFIKDCINEKDFEDIIRTTLCYHKVDLISISLPALVIDDRVETDYKDLLTEELPKYLEDIFHIPVILSNNANAIAVGIYSTNNQYRNFIYYSLPLGSREPGMGTIIDGKLVRGFRGFAGENKYLPEVLNFEEDIEERKYTPKGASEIIAKELLPVICAIGPEAVFIRNKLTPDTSLIYKLLSYYMPKKYIPDLIHVDDIEEYLSFGQLMICAKSEIV